MLAHLPVKLSGEEGQDLGEYVLALALVALVPTWPCAGQ